MTLVFRALTLALVSLSTTISATGSLSAAVINFVDAPPAGAGTDFRLESISQLEINGGKYDVTFHHGVSFDSLVNAVAFSTPASAVSALDTLVNYINSEGIDASAATSFSNGILVPFSQAGPVVQSVAEVNLALNPLTYSNFDIFPFQLASSPLAADTAFATFVRVPEPGTFAMGILALCIGFGCSARPTRQRAAR